MANDVLAVRMDELSKQKDWAGLVRLAMSSDRALSGIEKAIRVTESDRTTAADWLILQLRQFSDGYQDPKRQIDVVPSGTFRLSEELTLKAMGEFPFALMCVTAASLPYEHQKPAFEIGVVAARRLLQLSQELDDTFLEAHALSLVADYFERCGTNEESEASRRDSAQVYLQLESDVPGLARQELSGELSSLANEYRTLRRYDEALDFGNQALRFAEGSSPNGTRLQLARMQEALTGLGITKRKQLKLEDAASYFQKSVKVTQQLANTGDFIFRRALAGGKFNLATVYDDAGKYEEARRCHKEANAIFRDLMEVNPIETEKSLAQQLNSYAVTLQRLGRFTEARELAREALDLRGRLADHSPKQNLIGVSAALRNLANLASTASDHSDAFSLEYRAFEIYSKLESAYPGQYASLVAEVCQSLCHTCRDLGHAAETNEKRVACFAQAVDFADQALDCSKQILAGGAHRQGDILQLVRSYQAAACAKVDSSRDEDALKNIKDAYDLWSQQPVEVQNANPDLSINVFRDLGNLLIQSQADPSRESIHLAIDSLKRALGVGESLRQNVGRRWLRTKTQMRLQSIYDGLVKANVLKHLEDSSDSEALWDALRFAELGRSRAFIEELNGQERMPASGVPEYLVTELLDYRKKVAEAGTALERAEEKLEELSRSDESPAHIEERGGWRTRVAELEGRIEQLNANLLGAIDAIREFEPEFSNDVFSGPLGISGLKETAAATASAVLYFVVLKEETLAFAIFKTKIEIVRLQDLGADSINRWGTQWLSAYDNRAAGSEWTAISDRLLAEIGRKLFWPVCSLIEGHTEELTIVPHRSLHVLPLHLATIGEHKRLCDSFRISYIQSLSVLAVCQSRVRDSRSHLLTLDVPSDLVGREAELPAIEANGFESTVRLRPDENWELEFYSAAMAADVIHVPAHCMHDYASTLDSRIDLGNAAGPLRIRDVVRDLHGPNLRLVVLSACESGMLQPDDIDEFLSFPTAFLFAGSKATVSSLWAVDDIATTLLMDRFYTNWKSGLTLSDSLHWAQRWLKGSDDHKGMSLTDGSALDHYVFEERKLDQAIQSRIKRKLFTKMLKQTIKTNASSPPYGHWRYWSGFVVNGHRSERFSAVDDKESSFGRVL